MSRLQSRLLRGVRRANKQFGLIEDGDHVMVAISGGKDSWALLDLLRCYAKDAPFKFTITAVNLDQGQPGFPPEVLRDYLTANGYAHRIVFKDTYSVVVDNTPEGKAFCALCSRMRRGILYDIAEELGANKLALGHHRDDFIETLLLNQFFSGRLRSMAARLPSTTGQATVIRPLVLCGEDEIAAYAEARQFPIIPCNLCGSQENLQRQNMKALLAQLEKSNPRIRGNLLASLGNVDPTHLLDQRLIRQADLPPSEATSAELIQIS